MGLALLELSKSLFLGVTHRTGIRKRPELLRAEERGSWMEKEPFDGDPRALHQGMGSPDHSCSLGPLKLGQQVPNNDAPSEGAANSQCQISKLTTTTGGLGPLSGSFQSVC